jgi:predicted dehydrogenase
MVHKVEARKGFLQIGFELRYSRLYTKVKDWIDAGLLGEVLNTHCYYTASSYEKSSWRVKKARSGCMFGEKLSHYVDVPRWWIGGDVTDVSTYSAPNSVPYMEIRDNYHSSYRFSTGAVSHLTFMMGPAATFRGDPLQCITDQQIGDGHALRFFVAGSKGAAATDVFVRSIKRWQYTDTPKTLESDLVETLTWDKAEDHLYYHNTHDQTLDIVRRVEQGLPPKTPARDAFETMRLCFAAELSADLQRPVRLDEPFG